LAILLILGLCPDPLFLGKITLLSLINQTYWTYNIWNYTQECYIKMKYEERKRSRNFYSHHSGTFMHGQVSYNKMTTRLVNTRLKYNSIFSARKQSCLKNLNLWGWQKKRKPILVCSFLKHFSFLKCKTVLLWAWWTNHWRFSMVDFIVLKYLFPFLYFWLYYKWDSPL